jgi:hypothetical protein
VTLPPNAAIQPQAMLAKLPTLRPTRQTFLISRWTVSVDPFLGLEPISSTMDNTTATRFLLG